MELEEAKEILINVMADEVVGTYCNVIQKTVECSKNCENEDCFLQQAIDTVIVELDRLQKGNEELMNEYHKRVQERIDIEQELKDSISKDKIRERMEELDEKVFSKPYDIDTADGSHSQAMGMWLMCRELLKEE